MTFLVKNLVRTVIYTTLVVVIFGLPSYFYIKSTVLEEQYRALSDCVTWFHANEKSFFEKGKMIVPQSVRFKINVYDSNDHLIYRGIEADIKNRNFKTAIHASRFYYQKELRAPNAEIVYVLIEHPINYIRAIFLSVLLLLIIPFIIFLLSHYFILISVYPYEQMRKYMDVFFNDAMHELKTPLGVIKINLDLMKRQNADSKHIQRMTSAVKQMQTSYDDVEYYIKHSRFAYPLERLPFSALLKERIDFFQDVAFSKNVGFLTEIDDDIFVDMSIEELKRMIDNNISNAIKYSDAGASITVSLKPFDEDHILFSVKNVGRPIKDKSKVFKRFRREDVSQGGFGLGLSIVQYICNKYGILIDLVSEEETGTIFTYRFKRAKIGNTDE